MAVSPAISNFWISSFPYFSSTLLLSSSGLFAESEHQFLFFDPDGEIVNEVTCSFEPGQCNSLELDTFLESCKLEAGLKHCHLQVTSPPGTRHQLRIHSKESACFSGPAVPVSANQGGFFPLVLTRDRSFLLGIINRSDVEGNLRVRLFAGSRAPETTCLVPARGARIVSIPAEFPSYIPEGAGKHQQAYLRMGTTSDSILGVQLIERNDTIGDRETYSSVS